MELLEQRKDVDQNTNISVDIYLSIIEQEEGIYIEFYERLEKVLQMKNIIEKNSDTKREDLSNKTIIEKEITCLIKYIENKLNEFDFINLEKYQDMLSRKINENRSQIRDIDNKEEKLISAQIKYSKKKIRYYFDKKEYDEFIQNTIIKIPIWKKENNLKLITLKNIQIP